MSDERRVLKPGVTGEDLLADMLAIVHDEPPPSCSHGAPSCSPCLVEYAQRLLRQSKRRTGVPFDCGKES